MQTDAARRAPAPYDHDRAPEDSLWTIWPGEPARAHHAFEIYRDQGPRRSMRATSERWHSIDPPQESHRRAVAPTVRTHPSGTITAWARKWSWALRASAFDVAESQRRLVERSERIREYEDRLHAVGRLGLARFAEWLGTVQGQDLSPTVAVRLGEVSARLMAQALDRPAVILEVNAPSPIDHAMEELLGSAAAEELIRMAEQALEDARST